MRGSSKNIVVVSGLMLAVAAVPALSRETVRHHAVSRAATRIVPQREVGKASVYSSALQGRHMTDGERFNVASNAAASKTLPIGTRARVTDLKTGRSADVTIKDRGPVPKGRVVDLTPHTAREIGLTKKEGIAPVAVVPPSLPGPQTAAARP